jgi:hypothetical protein
MGKCKLQEHKAGFYCISGVPTSKDPGPQSSFRINSQAAELQMKTTNWNFMAIY